MAAAAPTLEKQAVTEFDPIVLHFKPILKKVERRRISGILQSQRRVAIRGQPQRRLGNSVPSRI